MEGKDPLWQTQARKMFHLLHFPREKGRIRTLRKRRARRQVAGLTRWQRRVSARGQGASHLPLPSASRPQQAFINPRP